MTRARLLGWAVGLGLVAYLWACWPIFRFAEWLDRREGLR